MVDSRGDVFKPGPFARRHLTLDLLGERCYLYGDVRVHRRRSRVRRSCCKLDAGVAARPLDAFPRLEFRLGTDEITTCATATPERTVYGAVRIRRTDQPKAHDAHACAFAAKRAAFTPSSLPQYLQRHLVRDERPLARRREADLDLAQRPVAAHLR